MGETTAVPRVAGFELGRLIAHGATSEVWEAVREADGRRVAVKVARGDPESVGAAAREASLASAAASAHVVPVEACLPLDDGRLALVMPLLRGGDLAALVRARGHLSAGEVVTVLAPVAGALGRLHALGVVHGDVSPGNVLLDLDGRPSLADLGLGRVVGEEPAAVWGTDGFVAPEVLLGADPSSAADVYGVGALGWFCLTGAAPGPPGLRPELGEVSLAGASAEPVLSVLSAAVAPCAQDRPGAGDLAWALFEAAEAAPLHLVRGDDEVSAVTYRLRAAAAAEGDDAALRRWAWPRPGSGGRARRPRHAAPAAPVSRRGGFGRRATRPPVRWRGALLAAVVAAGVAAGGITVAVARSGGGPAARPTARPTAPPAALVDPRAESRAPAEHPADLLRELADARSEAWRAADPLLLLGAEVEGSPAHARDVLAVEELARAGVRYEGLRHDVTDVTTVSASDGSAVLRARLGTGAYAVVGPGPAATRAAAPGTRVRVELAWTADGWRVTDIRPDE
jgi:hypothetical protein